MGQQWPHPRGCRDVGERGSRASGREGRRACRDRQGGGGRSRRREKEFRNGLVNGGKGSCYLWKWYSRLQNPRSALPISRSLNTATRDVAWLPHIASADTSADGLQRGVTQGVTQGHRLADTARSRVGLGRWDVPGDEFHSWRDRIWYEIWRRGR